MTVNKAMSREEHDEAVASISTGVVYIIKMGKILIPIVATMFAFIMWIGYKAISLNEWNKSLIKDPQYTQDKQRQAKVDSTQTANIDTLRSKIPVIRFTNVIQRNGKFIPVN